MISSLIVIVAQAAGVPALGAIGRQDLPAKGCAAFLWSTSEAEHASGPVAMASTDPAMLRLSLDGKVIDVPRVAQHGDGGFGLAASIDYRSAALAATLAITVAQRGDLRDGAAVPQATLRLAREGQDELVVPLAGLIGCRPAS